MRRPMIVGLALALGACGGQETEAASCHSPAEGHAAHEEHAAHTGVPIAAGQPTLDGASLFHLDADLSLRDQHDAPFALESLRGRPTLITFFYGGCTTMCPLIVADVHRIVSALPEDARGETRVVLVTIDPERDTPERLRAIASERAMPESWHLVGGDEGSIRSLASTLGMTYRRLPDGSFAHAALYTVLDREGRIAHQLDGTGQSIDEIAGALRRAVGPGPS